MSRDTRRGRGTQEAILRSAEGLFTRFGYARVTMDDIAAESALKKPSLYYYYATKEALFNAVLESRRSEFRAHIGPLLASDRPPGVRIMKYVEARFHYFKGLQELNILEFKQATGDVLSLKEMFKRYGHEEGQWLTEILEVGRHSGEFTMTSSKATSEMFLHVLQGLRLRFIRESGAQRPTAKSFAQLRREMAMFTEVFLAGIQHPFPRHVKTRNRERTKGPIGTLS